MGGSTREQRVCSPKISALYPRFFGGSIKLHQVRSMILITTHFYFPRNDPAPVLICIKKHITETLNVAKDYSLSLL